MADDEHGRESSAPMSVAERVAALQKAAGSKSNSFKPIAPRKLSTAAKPPANDTDAMMKVKKNTKNALVGRIAAFQTSVEKAEPYPRISTAAPFINTNLDDTKDSKKTTVTDCSSSDHVPPPPKSKTISMASRISALQKTIDPERRSFALHPSRNMASSIQTSVVPAAKLPSRVSNMRKIDVKQHSIEPDRPSESQPEIYHKRIALKPTADDKKEKQTSLNPAILTDVKVRDAAPPLPKRQGLVLKDATNIMNSEIKSKRTSLNLPPKPTRTMNQNTHAVSAGMDYVMNREKENTLSLEDFKSTTGVSEVDSDMITVPASNTKATHDSSFDSSSSWNYERTINGWQNFYLNYDIPPSTAMMESNIDTPVIKNTGRKTSSVEIVDDFVIREPTERKNSGERSRALPEDKRVSNDNRNDPSHRGQRRKSRSSDFCTTSRKEELEDDQAFDLNGCLINDMIDEIWYVFNLLTT